MGFEQDKFQRPLSTPTILWFCDLLISNVSVRSLSAELPQVPLLMTGNKTFGRSHHSGQGFSTVKICEICNPEAAVGGRVLGWKEGLEEPCLPGAVLCGRDYACCPRGISLSILVLSPCFDTREMLSCGWHVWLSKGHSLPWSFCLQHLNQRSNNEPLSLKIKGISAFTRLFSNCQKSGQGAGLNNCCLAFPSR